MIRWSRTGMPRSCPASVSRRVTSWSSSEGSRLPDGWLCATIVGVTIFYPKRYRSSKIYFHDPSFSSLLSYSRLEGFYGHLRQEITCFLFLPYINSINTKSKQNLSIKNKTTPLSVHLSISLSQKPPISTAFLSNHFHYPFQQSRPSCSHLKRTLHPRIWSRSYSTNPHLLVIETSTIRSRNYVFVTRNYISLV